MADYFYHPNPKEWIKPRKRNFKIGCCDCGLVHRFEFRVVDDQIEYRARRDDKASDKLRSVSKFAFIRKPLLSWM